jgi:hypothetical protein
VRRTLIVLLVLTACGCGSGERPQQPPGRVAIAENAGAIGAVRIGSSKAMVRRVFGSYGAHPTAYPGEPSDVAGDETTGGPWSVVTGPHHLGPGGLRGEQVTLRYPGVAFFVHDDRVFGFLASARGAHTSRGVKIGDRLARVREAYPRFHCEPASRGETTATQAASCSGTVAGGRLLYFGEDPIRSITVMAHALSHYAY